MNTMTESERAQERAKEVKLILRRLLVEVEEAEANAAETTWDEEKASFLNEALSIVSWRCSNLGYDLGYTSGNLLKKQERE